MAETAFQTQYRDEFIASFEEFAGFDGDALREVLRSVELPPVALVAELFQGLDDIFHDVWRLPC